ncbi:hypothetical protein N0V90_009446 [Kalmusia sp. IMI 367209]|nr:hypothetical protein N0V90_009446 [Kalmusia sp. IMI 367209]
MEDAERAIISRRWTDELTERDVPRSTRAVPSGNDALSIERQQMLKQLYESPNEENKSAQDFEVANVAREQLQKMVDKFDEDAKPSTWQQLGLSHKSRKAKAAEVLRTSMDGDISELKASVNSLETEWKEKHGQAAKSHTEISLLLSKSIAEISDKVATCSIIIDIIKTPRTKRKLADIYARMLQFYQRTLEWYLQSRFGRFMRSFNENLLKEFEEAKSELEDSINELYREAAVANTAMVAMVNGKMANLEMEIWRQRKNYEVRDAMAGQRMQKMMQATWTEVKQLEGMIEKATLARPSTPEVSSGYIEEAGLDHAADNGLMQAAVTHLDSFILDNEGLKLFSQGRFWVAEKETMLKLRAWMSEGTSSRTIWISSPYESRMAITGSRAAAMITVAAAWQAETPIISAFCTRPQPDQLRSSSSIEQVGLISLSYSLIRQLLQFDSVIKSSAVKQTDLNMLDGKASTWPHTLKIVATLLKYVPDVTFCVIDGLNEFEWGNGGLWARELVEVLQEKQKQTEGAFNILFTTAGQSYVLPKLVDIGSRHLATKKATEVGKSGATSTFRRGFT